MTERLNNQKISHRLPNTRNKKMSKAKSLWGYNVNTWKGSLGMGWNKALKWTKRLKIMGKTHLHRMEHYHVSGIKRKLKTAFVWTWKKHTAYITSCPMLAERPGLPVWMTSMSFGEFHEKRELSSWQLRLLFNNHVRIFQRKILDLLSAYYGAEL